MISSTNVTNSSTDGRTETSVQKLTAQTRIREIARMLSGSEITELTLKHADELIQMAEQIKNNKVWQNVKNERGGSRKANESCSKDSGRFLNFH